MDASWTAFLAKGPVWHPIGVHRDPDKVAYQEIQTLKFSVQKYVPIHGVLVGQHNDHMAPYRFP